MYGTNWTHLVQQKTSRTRDTVEVDSNVVGQRKSYNQIGVSSMEEITTRNGESTDMDRLDEKRWVSLKPYHAVKWFDEWDDALLGNIVKPTSETVRSQGMAAARTIDQTVIDALGGTALTGEDGTTSTALPSTQQVIANFSGGGSEGMTIEKLIEAKSILGVNEVTGQSGDDDPLVCVIAQKQLDNMLLIAKIQNIDTAEVRALVNGEVNTYMGFRFIRTQLLPLTAGDIRSCYCYVRSAVKLAVGQDIQSRMDILPQRNHSLQIRSTLRLGATRMEEEKVVEILCDESP